MKVLVTGARGQLGLDVVDAFADHDVVGIDYGDLDVADEPAVFAAVGDLEPDLVVHAAAWTDVDGCEGDPDRAHRVNALGAWWVARACRAVGAAMVALSTDYVFGGSRGGEEVPYTEFDALDPVNVYGRSKAAAEQLVAATLDEHYIVRTSWLCGARGKNFVATMLRLGSANGDDRAGEAVRVVEDQVGSPTFTRDLAAAIRQLAVSGRYGTYHRTNRGTCSWFEFADAIFDLARMEVDLRAITSDELDRRARRPAYSVLSDRHSVLSGLEQMPHWRDGLARLLDEMRALPEGGG